MTPDAPKYSRPGRMDVGPEFGGRGTSTRDREGTESGSRDRRGRRTSQEVHKSRQSKTSKRVYRKEVYLERRRFTLI